MRRSVSRHLGQVLKARASGVICWRLSAPYPTQPLSMWNQGFEISRVVICVMTQARLMPCGVALLAMLILNNKYTANNSLILSDASIYPGFRSEVPAKFGVAETKAGSLQASFGASVSFWRLV